MRPPVLSATRGRRTRRPPADLGIEDKHARGSADRQRTASANCPLLHRLLRAPAAMSARSRITTQTDCRSLAAAAGVPPRRHLQVARARCLASAPGSKSRALPCKAENAGVLRPTRFAGIARLAPSPPTHPPCAESAIQPDGRRVGESALRRSGRGARESPIAGLTRAPGERARCLCSAGGVYRLTRRPRALGSGEAIARLGWPRRSRSWRTSSPTPYESSSAASSRSSACASSGQCSRTPRAARQLSAWRSASRPRASQASRAIVSRRPVLAGRQARS